MIVSMVIATKVRDLLATGGGAKVVKVTTSLQITSVAALVSGVILLRGAVRSIRAELENRPFDSIELSSTNYW